MNDGSTVRFLSGADMAPGAIRERWPGARFVARARVRGADLGIPGAGSGSGADDDVWGILIEDGAGEADGADPMPAAVNATTDDGRSVAAVPVAAGVAVGSDADRAAVLAAARYWELPPAYVAGLAAAIPPVGGA